MSIPACADGTVEWVPPQSEVTKPPKPNWFRSTCVSMYGFWQAYSPLIVAYEHITEAAPPLLTAAWKAGR
jgi:hypothetical protein